MTMGVTTPQRAFEAAPPARPLFAWLALWRAAARRWPALALGLALGGLLLLLWPQALGGATAFVVLQSDSMAPRFRRGDLVVVRQQSSYAVGDAVVYRARDLAQPVFHRIVGYDAQGRFVLRGDANDYRDPEHPAPADILGRYWFALPRVGGWLWAQRPLLLAASVGLAWWLWVGPAPGRVSRRRRRRGA